MFPEQFIRPALSDGLGEVVFIELGGRYYLSLVVLDEFISKEISKELFLLALEDFVNNPFPRKEQE